MNEIVEKMAEYTVSIEYEVSNSGAYRGVGWQWKTFPGTEIEEARQFARTHDCICREVSHKPSGRSGPKVAREYFALAGQLDAMKAVTA